MVPEPWPSENLEMSMTKGPDTRPAPKRDPTRKPYETPSLVVLGSVVDITMGTTPQGVNDPGNSKRSAASDRALKENLVPVEPKDALRALLSLPVSTWNYKWEGEGVRHLGPMAQDFAAALGVGEDDKHIDMVDANGVLIAALQGLQGELVERDQKIQRLEMSIADLMERTSSLEAYANRKTDAPL
jgi:Chaperone of endosialidase